MVVLGGSFSLTTDRENEARTHRDSSDRKAYIFSEREGTSSFALVLVGDSITSPKDAHVLTLVEH